MIGGKKVLAVIPARGGSKGIPGKNLVKVGDKSLLEWTIASARASTMIDRVILSSDDVKIQAVAIAAGCEVPFMRPAVLATDEAGSAEVLVHALEQCPGFDFAILLQPTSPLRTASDIDAALQMAEKSDASSVVSVSEASKHPAWMFFLGVDGVLEPVLKDFRNAARRQELPPAYQLNGAVYVVKVQIFLKEKAFIYPDTQAYLMPSARSLDIDSPEDLLYMKAYIEEQHGKI